ncbi:hypothetical protein AAVH_25106 [Aphelenchoides avenae]|nr:hypothetical protein AAVH_25106 [Aphelenchus avenae]
MMLIKTGWDSLLDRKNLYGLRLYAPKLAHFPVQIVNETIDILSVPKEYVLGDNQPVKVFEKDIDGALVMPS